jgi:hypothetical protein
MVGMAASKVVKRRKLDEDRKEARIVLRVTEAQKGVLEAAAKVRGLTLSSWVLTSALEASGAVGGGDAPESTPAFDGQRRVKMK